MLCRVNSNGESKPRAQLAEGCGKNTRLSTWVSMPALHLLTEASHVFIGLKILNGVATPHKMSLLQSMLLVHDGLKPLANGEQRGIVVDREQAVHP